MFRGSWCRVLGVRPETRGRGAAPSGSRPPPAAPGPAPGAAAGVPQDAQVAAFVARLPARATAAQNVGVASKTSLCSLILNASKID